jgi:hypothetical protein
MMSLSSSLQEGWLDFDISALDPNPTLQPVIDWLNTNLGEYYGTYGAEMFADDWEFSYKIVNGEFHYVVRFTTQQLLEKFRRDYWDYGRH